MKHFFKIIVLMIVVSSAGFSQWIPQSSGTTQTLLGVAVLDYNTAIVIGDSGTILKTTDHGTHWTSRSNGTILALRRVHFVSGQEW